MTFVQQSSSGNPEYIPLRKLLCFAKKVKTSVFPENKSQFVFAAAESAMIKEIQYFLKEEKALNCNDWQAFAYWKLDLSEGA